MELISCVLLHLAIVHRYAVLGAVERQAVDVGYLCYRSLCYRVIQDANFVGSQRAKA